MFLGPAGLFKFPIFRHRSDQEEKKEAPPSGPQKKPSLHTVSFVGDEHVHVMPYISSAYRALVTDNYAPGLRLPMSNLAAIQAREVLLRQAIESEDRLNHQGTVSIGDETDVASTEELNAYYESASRLKIEDPSQALRLQVTSNHTTFHGGVADYGLEGGLLAWFLGLGGVRSHRDDIHKPEVGGEENILDKGRYVELLFKKLLRREPDPVVLLPSDRESYLLKDRTTGWWRDTETVFHRFWKRTENGISYALIEYDPADEKRAPEEGVLNEKKASEQSILFVSAFKLGEVSTSSGPRPIYVVGMDHEDYLTDPVSGGALKGGVSPFQVALLKAYIEETKKKDPNAKFILVGHYPVMQIVEDRLPVPVIGLVAKILDLSLDSEKESVLKPVLSDESVLAVIGAHTHRRGFVENLCRPVILGEGVNEKYCPADRSPLPQIVVPSVIEYPNEMVLLKYGLDEKDPNKLVFEFRFVGIDPQKVPGFSADVWHEYERLKPDLLTYTRTLKLIRDPRFQKLADRRTSRSFWRCKTWSETLQKLDLLINIDRGALWDPEKANDQIVLNDVIPGMVVAARLVGRVVLSDIKLSLLSASLAAEAEGLDKAYPPLLDELSLSYRRIVNGRYSTGEESQKLDRLVFQVNKASLEVGEKIVQALKSGTLTLEQKQDLQTALLLLDGLARWTDAGRHWLTHYEQNRKTGRRASEFIDESNLFGDPGFRVIWDQLPNLRYGSAPAALNTLLFLESSKLRFKYQNARENGEIPEELLKGGAGFDVPDKVRLEMDLQSGKRRLLSTPVGRREIEQRLHWWSRLPTTQIEREKVSLQSKLADSFLRFKGIAGHFQLYFGVSLGRGETFGDAVGANPLSPSGGNRGTYFSIGGQWHLIDDWRIPLRLNFHARVGMDLNYKAVYFEDQFTGDIVRESVQVEFPGKMGLSLGDPWGYIEAGALGVGGWANRSVQGKEDPDLREMRGVGLDIGLFERSILLEGTKRFYIGGDKEWHFSLNLELWRTFIEGEIFSGVGHEAPKLPQLSHASEKP